MSTATGGAPRLDGRGGDVYLDLGMRGWIANFARKNYWRVCSWYSLEDLIQDGYMCFAKCRSRYREKFDTDNPTKDQRRHFQALVKTTFSNHISDLALKNRQLPMQPVSALAAVGESDTWFEDKLSAEAPAATVTALLAGAPAELRALLVALTGDVSECIQRLGGRRETTNEFWCRLVGADPAERDLRRELQEYLS